MTIIICTLCGQEKVHHTRGLCNACACWARDHGILQSFSKGRRAPAGGHSRAAYWREYKRSKAHGDRKD